MNVGYWVLKTEPGAYSFDDLVREQTAVWDGVRNPVALRNLSQMKPGDPVLVYHTGSEKAVVGRAEVASEAFADPQSRDPKLLVVKLRAGDRLKRPVTLAQIKKDPVFAEMALVRQGRLSVVPATEAQFRKLVELGS